MITQFYIYTYIYIRANVLQKRMNPSVFPSAIGKIVGQTKFFSLGKATNLGEGEHLKIDLVSPLASGGGFCLLFSFNCILTFIGYLMSKPSL